MKFQKILFSSLKGQFNDSQKKAVEVITESVLQPYVLPRVCLLHGPPGTGKSHTIAGIVQHVIKVCEVIVFDLITAPALITAPPDFLLYFHLLSPI